MKRSYEKSQKFGRWTIQECLGGGGNGQVWKSTNDERGTAAIKLLRAIVSGFSRSGNKSITEKIKEKKTKEVINERFGFCYLI